MERAAKLLNKDRKKAFTVNAEFHFVDSSQSAIEHLRSVLQAEGYGSEIDKTIFLKCAEFAEHYPELKRRISARTQKGVGRSLFLLDQKGYSSAPFNIVRDILGSFSAAEVILTFAVDFLINHMSSDERFLKAVSNVELSAKQIQEWLSYKKLDRGRYLIQRGLKDHMLQATGAAFISPFFIRSNKSSRDLWVVHLSRHPRARNVMVDAHWDVNVASRHPGMGGLEIAGFDVNYDPMVHGTMLFADHERDRMHERLHDDFSKRLVDIHEYEPVSYKEFIGTIANQTPARLADINGVISNLIERNEVVLLDSAGTQRRTLKPSERDFIRKNPQSKLF